MLPGMDFHTAFQAIDTDNSGEITIDELQVYCKKMNYKESFVQKWLNLFDEDESGTITYEEFCNTLGLIPKKEVIEQHKAAEQESAAGGASGSSSTTTKANTSKTKNTTTTKTTKTTTTTKTSKSESQSKSEGRSRNRILSGSLMQFSRARMFQRKALYRLEKKFSRQLTKKTSSEAGQGFVTFSEKQIGGEKNGGSRQVASRRMPKSLPMNGAKLNKKLRPTKTFSQHKRRIRASIQPGSVLILLAGRHRGKRVVFLKQLDSGLLLVTGPMRVNGCPLRRIGQKFVIATKTRVNLDSVQVPDRVNDQYFRRVKQAKQQSRDANDLFQQEKQPYELTQERKEDQKEVDAQILAAIASSDEKKLLLSYMRSQFCLKKGQRPHEMQF